MYSFLWFLLALAFIGFLDRKVARLEKRVAWMEKLNMPPKQHDPYRSPPASECERCPESSPAACQSCHEEEEAHQPLPKRRNRTAHWREGGCEIIGNELNMPHDQFVKDCEWRATQKRTK
jgi:hypothetical protein